MAKDSFSFYDKPRFTVDEISLALTSSSPEYTKLKEELVTFIVKNHKYLSVPELSQVLGVSPKVILSLLPKKYHHTINQYKAQTVIIWRSPEVADEDSERFKEYTL